MKVKMTVNALEGDDNRRSKTKQKKREKKARDCCTGGTRLQSESSTNPHTRHMVDFAHAHKLFLEMAIRNEEGERERGEETKRNGG